jgi:hypothetical protein
MRPQGRVRRPKRLDIYLFAMVVLAFLSLGPITTLPLASPEPRRR